MSNNLYKDIGKGGETITFYSYKGGVGRSMALVNTACLLAKKNKKVLIIDWDVEAPGIHFFFNTNKEKLGLIDLVTELSDYVKEDDKNNEQSYIDFFNKKLDDFIDQEISPTNSDITVKIDLLKAGKFGTKYSEKLDKINWLQIYKTSPSLFRTFAYHLEKIYDYILIDSRTGLADSGGITTMLMPRKLVMVFAINQQNINGVVDIAGQAIDYRLNSNDVRSLNIYPLPSRVENTVSEDLQTWIANYQKKFEQLFKEKYLIDDCNLSAYFDRCYIPYFPKHAHGENIPVLIEQTTSPAFITYYYNSFLTVVLKNIPPWETVSLEQEVKNEKLANELFINALDLRSTNKLSEMISLYDQIIELSPNNYHAYTNRAIAKDLLGDTDGAIEDFNYALSLNSINSTIFFNRANLKARLKDYQGAIEDYTLSIEISPDDYDSYLNRGNSKKELKDYNGAINDFNRAAELKPDEQLTYLNRGHVKNELRDFIGSILDFDKVIELNPKSHIAYFNRSDSKRNIKDWSGALHDLDKALELDPNSIETIINRGILHGHLKNYPDAIMNFNKAIELDTNNSNAYFLRGLANVHSNRIEEAKKDMLLATKFGNPLAEEFYNTL